MKRLLSALLVAVMLLSVVMLPACDNNTDPAQTDGTNTPSGTAATDPSKAPTDPTDEPTDPVDPTDDEPTDPIEPTEETTEPTEAPTEAPTQAPTEAVPEFSLGSAVGSTYTNDFLGLSCTLPSGWEYYTDQQILEMNNLVGDAVGDDIAETLSNAAIIYDMMATKPDEGASISVNLEKHTALQLIGIDLQQTLEAQIPTIETAFSNMGYENVSVIYQKVIVDGKSYDALVTNANVMGSDYYGVTFAFVKGSYIANVSVGCMAADYTDVYLSYFTID